MKRRTWAAMLMVLGGLAWLAQPIMAAETKVLMDEWRAMYLGGQKAGYDHITTVEESSPGAVFYITTTHSELVVSRAGASMNIVTDSVMREDAQGRVVEFQHKSPLAQSTHGVLMGSQFTVTSTGLTGATSRQIAPPTGLGPWAAELMGRQKGYLPGTTYTADLFMPETPETPIHVKVAVASAEQVQVYDVKKWLHPLAVDNSLLPGVPTQQWVDDEGTAWLTRVALTPDMQIETRKTTREFATSASEPAELLTKSYIFPDMPIERPRELNRLEVLLTPVGAGGPVPSPLQDVGQAVSAQQGGLLVTVSRAHAPEKGYELPYRESQYADQLRANKWLEVDDPLIRDMAREAVGDATDSVTAARRIESYVGKKIAKKGLGVGMATAGETARQLEGDCSEHAMLAAALARAAGMPSRIVGGLAYVERLPGTRQYRLRLPHVDGGLRGPVAADRPDTGRPRRHAHRARAQ